MLLLIKLLAVVVLAGVAWRLTLGTGQPFSLGGVLQLVGNLPEPFATVTWVLVAILGVMLVLLLVRFGIWLVQELREG